MLVSLFHKIGRPLRWFQGKPHPTRHDLGAAASGPLLADGNRPNDGPPDLDQLWRDFNKRLNSWLGQGRNGAPSNETPPDLKGAGIGAGVVLVVITFFWLLSGFFIVQEGQTAVILTFGKNSHSTPAGFNWRWPYPVQSHEIVNVSQVRTVEVGYRGNAKTKQAHEALMLTDDENIVEVQFAVQYKVKNPANWIFTNRDQDEVLLRQVAETSIREVVGKSKMDFVLYEGREKVALDVAQLMQLVLDRYQSGVQVTNVTMQGVQPPEQVQSAFDDAVKAGQDQKRKQNEGHAYANDVIPKAVGDASRVVADAEAYSARVSETAAGDAARFKQVVAEYQKAPAVTRDRMYLETMQQIFANSSKVLIDAKGGNNLISLPLDKMMQGAASEQAKSGATPAQVVVTPQAGNDVAAEASRNGRGRDGRERESR